MKKELLDKVVNALKIKLKYVSGEEDDDDEIDHYMSSIKAIKAEIANPVPEVTIWLHISDIKMLRDKTPPYKLDFKQDESWGSAVPLLARLKT